MNEPDATGSVITFYSYKGGTGRSMALANVAWILASNAKRVLVIDWDLEAPGLHRYFHPFLEDPELKASPGVIEFVTDFAIAAVTPTADESEDADDGDAGSDDAESGNGESEVDAEDEWFVGYANILRYAKSLDYDFPTPGTIDFVPAGRQCPEYATRVNSFDWKNFYEKLGGGVFLEAALEHMADYDYVLIDSRTGVSDTSGICTVQLPDQVVVCFTLNSQSIQGAAAVATGIQDQRSSPDEAVLEDSETRPPFRIFPVPTRTEKAEHARLERARAEARDKFKPIVSKLALESEDTYWQEVEIRYQTFYAYEEVLAAFGDAPHSTSTMLASMEALTRRLTSGTVTGYPGLPEDERQQQLARFLRQDPSERRELGRGSAGPDVKQWQTLLGIAADGSFGPRTEERTKAWQSARGLVSDGRVTPDMAQLAAREPQSNLRFSGNADEHAGATSTDSSDDIWVYVSHSGADEQEYLRGFVSDLQHEVTALSGVKVSIFLDSNLRAGEAWQSAVLEALGRSRTALCLVSPAYLASDFCARELGAIVRLGIPIIPVEWVRSSGLPESVSPTGMVQMARVDGVEDLSLAMRLTRHRSNYREFVHKLALTLVKRGVESGIRRQSIPISSFSLLEPAWSTAPVRSNASSVAVAYLGPEARLGWSPFDGEEIGALVERLANEEGLSCEVLSGNLLENLNEAVTRNRRVLAVVDASVLARYRAALMLDVPGLRSNMGVVVVASPDEKQLEVAASNVLLVRSEASMRRALSTVLAALSLVHVSQAQHELGSAPS